MNDELMLVEPSEEYFAELAAYRNDFLENSDSMDLLYEVHIYMEG